MKNDIGTVVERKRDGARGTITSKELAVPCFACPGIYGKTIVTIRLEDETLRRASGGDMTGDLSWLKSNFRVASQSDL